MSVEFTNYNGAFVRMESDETAPACDVETVNMTLIEENILLKKQLRRLTRERDALKKYVPRNLLTLERIINN